MDPNPGGWATVAGYQLRTDVGYDPQTHLWVAGPEGGAGPHPDAVRVGFDPLGLEINGTLAQLALDPAGGRCERGHPLGSLEAEKFVGPVVAPISGTVEAVNSSVLADPATVTSHPFESWLVQIRPDPASWPEEQTQLVHGEAAIRAWFVEALRRYRMEGVLAE